MILILVAWPHIIKKIKKHKIWNLKMVRCWKIESNHFCRWSLWSAFARAVGPVLRLGNIESETQDSFCSVYPKVFPRPSLKVKIHQRRVGCCFPKRGPHILIVKIIGPPSFMSLFPWLSRFPFRWFILKIRAISVFF